MVIGVDMALGRGGHSQPVSVCVPVCEYVVVAALLVLFLLIATFDHGSNVLQPHSQAASQAGSSPLAATALLASSSSSGSSRRQVGPTVCGPTCINCQLN